MNQDISPNDPWIIAHRGVSATRPENTRAAFEGAIACGADAIECDLQLTADNEIVVCHDHTLQEYGHPDVVISESPREQLQKVDIGSCFGEEFSDQRLLSLTELLIDFGPYIPLLLELKTKHISAAQIEFLIDRSLSEIESASSLQQLYVLCFDADVLTTLHKRGNDIPLVWNTHTPDDITVEMLDGKPWLNALDGRIGRLHADTMRMLRQRALRAFTFPCNTEEEVLKAWDLQVDGIITDDPEHTREILKSNNRGTHDSGRQQTATRAS